MCMKLSQALEGVANRTEPSHHLHFSAANQVGEIRASGPINFDFSPVLGLDWLKRETAPADNV